MRHDDLEAGITHQHVVRQHVHHGTGDFCRVFIYRERDGNHQFLVHGNGLVRVEDNDRVPLVQYFHQWVEFLVAHVLPPAVRRQFYPVRAERVERIDSLRDGGIHVRQRQRGAEQELSGVGGLQPGAKFVVTTCRFPAFPAVAEIRLRGGHGQYGAPYARAIHESQMRGGIPFRQGKAFVQLRIVLFQRLHIERRDIMAMHVHHVLCVARQVTHHEKNKKQPLHVHCT